ncbi:hypothetical protein SAMN04488074_12816 [Lentzea albidocapillata subsp. violacea]|uniref:Uncharacterized protein n=1 Tax=Lentzea albidocapillata subsp. violacea TaxID=128104 RepID=A0A1G9WMW1_9PSEU|nr:hypothetical protein [Lentzea albidocapillata]SDM85687.1 hypothetical protein SAMN04488074_12816 [Lentzea albidocapillata subsp. violacea]
MFSYSGPARLIYADGNAVVMDRVDLIETVNDGVWQLSGAGTATGALTGGEARIKLPTGGEADVLVSGVRVSGSSSTVTLLGT